MWTVILHATVVVLAIVVVVVVIVVVVVDLNIHRREGIINFLKKTALEYIKKAQQIQHRNSKRFLVALPGAVGEGRS